MPRSRYVTLLATAALAILRLPTIAGAAGTDHIAQQAAPLTTVEQLVTPTVDRQVLLAEDAERAGPGVPMRFAVPQEVRITPQTHGTWETLADGSELWRLRIHSPGAVSLNFGFTDYSLPAEATLVVYNPDTSIVLGPYSDSDNKAHRQLWTPLVPGDEAILEVRLPANKADNLALELTSVNHGYREFGEVAREGSPDKSGACNVDVACPEGNNWDPQIRSVARLIISGGFACTGFMVNNTNQDFQPYFITAAHCNVTPANASS